MHENLRNEISDKYTSPPQFFKGTEEERQKWVMDVITEIIELDWHNYDSDKNGDLDEDESFKFIETLQPKPNLDREGYHKVFKKFDADGDGQLDKEEFIAFLIEIHGPVKVYSQDKIKSNMHANLKQLIIDNNVAKVFKGNEAQRQVWVKQAIEEIIASNWVIYDEDKNGAMDMD